MITITIETDNAAFSDKAHEVARILRELARRIENRGIDNISKVMDSNGNSVGTFTESR